jgi:hypothetical protein
MVPFSVTIASFPEWARTSLNVSSGFDKVGLVRLEIRCQCYKTFYSCNLQIFNNVERLALANLFSLVLCLWVRLEPT